MGYGKVGGSKERMCSYKHTHNGAVHTLDDGTTIIGYDPEVVSASDYFPFGMQMPGRSFSSDEYRYGFNGMEKDNEIKGNGNSYDFGARIYDSRLGRWLAVDPLIAKYPHLSPFSFAANNPLIFIDPNGEELKPTEALTKGLGSKWDAIRTNTTILKMAEKFDIKIDYNTNPGEGAVAHADGGYLIELNSNYYNSGSDATVIIKTVTHELIHTKLSRQMMSMIIKDEDGNLSWKENTNTMYPGILTYIKKYGYDDDKVVPLNNSTRGWQHNWMADHKRGAIISAMKENDKLNNTNRDGSNYSSDQWYEAISFAGLKGTNAWNKLTDEQKKLYGQILKAANEDVRTTLPEFIITAPANEPSNNEENDGGNDSDGNDSDEG